MLLLEGLLRTDHVTADQVVSACSGELLTLFNTSAKDRRRAKARKVHLDWICVDIIII